jgi:hypothetical protein
MRCYELLEVHRGAHNLKVVPMKESRVSGRESRVSGSLERSILPWVPCQS